LKTGVIPSGSLNDAVKNLSNRSVDTQFDGYLKVPKDGYYSISTGHPGYVLIDGVQVIDAYECMGPYDGEVAS
jgi:hypothetical protein